MTDTDTFRIHHWHYYGSFEQRVEEEMWDEEDFLLHDLRKAQRNNN
jgi:hypothetical protein